MIGAHYIIPRALVARSWEFLRERGSLRQEGMLLWAGRNASRHIAIDGLTIPGQTAIRTTLGVCVAMSDDAHARLHENLLPGQRYYVRVHSHPTRAYHSETDDANLILSHDGAISIVVPNFARNVLSDLTQVAVHEYSQAGGWRRLRLAEVSDRFRLR